MECQLSFLSDYGRQVAMHLVFSLYVRERTTLKVKSIEKVLKKKSKNT